MKNKKDTNKQKHKTPKNNPNDTHREITVGRTTYRITSEFLGTVDLGQTLERLAVSRVLLELETQTKAALLEK